LSLIFTFFQQKLLITTKMNDLIPRLSSRKFLLAAFGVFIVFFNVLNPEQTEAIKQLIIAFTIAEGAADVVSRFRQP